MNYLTSNLPADVGLHPSTPSGFEHDLGSCPLFERGALAEMLDRYPREHIQAATMGDDPLDPRWRSGSLGDLSGADILRAVEVGRLWLNVKSVHEHAPEFGDLTRDLYRELAAHDGTGPPSWFAATLLISSPTAFVGYHADAIPNILWHVHGRKRVLVYPALDEDFAPLPMIESIVAGECPEDLPYEAEFDDRAAVFDLVPGTGAMWPQNAPHRVVNVAGLNVSLSTEHVLPAARRRVYVLRANRMLRRSLGRVPASTATTGVGARAKIAMATLESAWRRLRRKAPVQFAFEPTFRVDPSAPTGFEDLPFAKQGRHASSAKWTLVEDEYRLEQLSEEWTALEGEHGGDLQFFQSHPWVREWWRRLGVEGGYTLHILIGREQGRLVMVWPLVLRRRGALRILEPPGGLMSAFHDVLISASIDAKQWLDEAWTELKARGGFDVLRMNLVHEHARVLDLMRRIGGQPVREMASPYLIGRGDTNYRSFDEYFEGLSRLTRKGHRKTMRRLAELGTVRITTNDPALPLERAVPLVLDYKRAWLDRNGLAGRDIATEGGRDFLLRFCRAAEDHPQIRTWTTVLWIDDHPAALGICFDYRGRIIDYVGGFDQDLDRYGIGRAQLVASIEGAFERGFEVYDFTTPSTEFKARWADREAPVYAYVAPVTTIGHSYRSLYQRRLRPLLKRLNQRYGPRIRRALGNSRAQPS